MKEEESSSTAFTVLQGIIYSGCHSPIKAHVPQALIESSEKILEAIPEGRRRLGQLQNPLARLGLRMMERFLVPGISFHYVLRKLYIEKVSRQAIADGYTQVIILGAGFDMLAWRLAQDYPDVRFIEIDHPATSQDKHQALKAGGLEQSGCHLLAADLSEQKLEEVLHSCPSFQADLKTLFVCEGVLMYLDEKEVSHLLATLKSVVKECRFVFSALEPMDSPDNNTGLLLKLYLRTKSEGLRWDISRAKMAEFLKENGYRMSASADDKTMHEELLPAASPGRLHRGEYLVLAEPAQQNRGD